MKTNRKSKILHVLNNSSIIIEGMLTEIVFIGKGIGFGRKPGDILPEGVEYDKSYHLLTKTNDFHRIINGYDDSIVVMVMDTIEEIIRHNTGDFTTNDLVVIADHLAAMFERLLKGEAVISFFATETKTLYPESFEKAQSVVNIINKQYDIDIPDAEIAYIALYLQNLSSTKSKKEIEQMSAIIVGMDDLFTQADYINIDKESIAYSRLLIHIHLLIQPLKFKKSALSPAISKAILGTYKNYTETAKEIIRIIEHETNTKLNKAELVYVVIHLVNLFEPYDEIEENL